MSALRLKRHLRGLLKRGHRLETLVQRMSHESNKPQDQSQESVELLLSSPFHLSHRFGQPYSILHNLPPLVGS